MKGGKPRTGGTDADGFERGLGARGAERQAERTVTAASGRVERGAGWDGWGGEPDGEEDG